jgi:hypothetical protein
MMRRTLVASLARALAPALLVATASLVTACSSPDPSATVSPAGPDRASFGPVARVLVRRCGSLDCHGSRCRNMRLYGYGSARLDPTSLPDSPADTTPAEIDADYDAVVALEPELMRQVVANKGHNASRLTFVRKGRGEEAHKGNQRIVPGDPADVCLLSWLAGDVAADACAAATRR